MTLQWPEPTHFQSSAAAQALDRVVTTIAVAHGLAVSGRAIDLSGLDAAAGILCAQVLDLPPHEGAAMRVALAELETKLSTLARTLAVRSR